MRRLAAIAASCLLFSAAAHAQEQVQAPEPTKKTAKKKKAAKPGTSAAAQASGAAAPTGSAAPDAGQGAVAAPGTAAGPSTAADPGAAAGKSTTAGKGAAAAGNPALAQPVGPGVDPEEFRRQVMEEVRRELQKTRDEVKQETAWVAQDSQARVQDSEAVEQLRQRVNLFQPHGYLRLRPEFLYDLDLGRGPDATGHTLFPVPFIGAPASGPGGSNHSISQANMRFRFEPTLEVSEDLAIYSQLDILDNVLLGSDPTLDPYLDPFTPLSVLTHGRAASAVKVKRVWGRVNTQLGELVFGRMGYHWGLGILHNDGNCLDCDFGDTYDRVAFSFRDFKSHKFTLMMDVLTKGQGTSGEYGELGRTVDLDTLDDGYRLAIEVVRLDTAEEAKRKLDAGQWVVNYGVVADYRTQAWDTVTTVTSTVPSTALGGFVGDRNAVARRGAKIYQPDAFLSLRRGKFRLDAELATQIGNVASRAVIDSTAPTSRSDATNTLANQPLTFFGVGFALQTDYAFLPANALLLGIELGGASADKGIYGFGARPWRNGSGGLQNQGLTTLPDGTQFRATGPGDIDGSRFNFADPNNTHGHINTFMFNRAYTVDSILFRNIISAVASAWYFKPSLRYRPSGRKSGGGDETGFELFLSAMYASTWYAETAPGLQKPLGIETDVGITYDTSDRFHMGLTYGLLLPLGGLKNIGQATSTGVIIPAADPSIAHAVRAIMAIPF
jgi:uncharacterized protein (TIGR04551 family)